MIIKRKAFKRLAEYYDLPLWLAFLPTGCECITEYILQESETTDKYDMPVCLVSKKLWLYALMCVPFVNLIMFIYYYIWHVYTFYTYVIPAIYPDINEWKQLLYAMLPTLLYLKICRRK